jgi:hypothetical protein
LKENGCASLVNVAVTITLIGMAVIEKKIPRSLISAEPYPEEVEFD